MSLAETMTDLKPETTLDDIRREIDTIDDAILDLLVRRFAATGKVRAAKSSDGSIATSPLRPAREASLLRRLAQKGEGKLSPDLLGRLWRVILSASTQSQAPITLHLDRQLAADLEARLLIHEHFCGMAVLSHGGLAEAFSAAQDERGDLAVVATTSGWANDFTALTPSSLQVIGILPVTGHAGCPELLVFGHAEPTPSGQDETLVVSPLESGAGQDASAGWATHSGQWHVTALTGFLPDDHPALRRFLEDHPGSRVAGRYPRSIEVGI